MRLILASASPRRAALLRAAGFVFETQAVDLDERVHPGEDAERYVRRLAMEKSARAMDAISARSDSGKPTRTVIVLGADTAVVLDGEILGKPRDEEEARSMLRRLSGRPHQVMTGISLREAGRELGRVETTLVDFAPLTDVQVAWYVASGEGRDKAGGYAIQGLASRFIPRIQGSYSNVVGLPIAAVQEVIAEIASAS